MDSDEAKKAKDLLSALKKASPSNKVSVLPDESFIFNRSECNMYKMTRSFSKTNSYTEKIEQDFPLAYAILTYNHAEQLDRLLRMIWRPQNFYCIHVDSKSSDAFKKAVESITSCFDNVFVSTKSERIVWAGISILQAELNCMSDLARLNSNWKYLIHMSGNEFPLKTNYELVKILSVYNGTNEIEITNGTAFAIRYKYKYEENADGKILPTDIFLEKPPHNFTVMKGYTVNILFCF